MKRIGSLILAVILGISMVGCKSEKKDDTVMTVNSQKISLDNYKKIFALNKQSIEYMYGPTIWDQEIEPGKKYSDKFSEMVVNQIVSTEVLYEQAKKEKLLPTEEEVNKSLGELKKAINADEKYKKQLNDAGLDEKFLKEQQERDLACQKYKENFKKTAKVSDEEIKKYYEENKSSFYKDEVKASHILISTKDKDNKDLSEQKKKEAKEKAEGILKRAKNGEEFAELAKENSDDKASAEKGGDLGFFAKGQMVESFEKAAYALKVGEVSNIVESQFGYHIIKVTDKVAEQIPFKDVKDKIKETLLEQKYSENISKLVKDAKVDKNESALSKITVK